MNCVSNSAVKSGGVELPARTATTVDATGEAVEPHRKLSTAQAVESTRVNTEGRWFKSILTRQFAGVAQLVERRVNNPSVPKPGKEKLVASEGCKPMTLVGLSEAGAENGVQNMHEVGGSSPSPRPNSTLDGHAKRPMRSFQFRWREPLGHDVCPYAHRTLLNLGWFSIRLHEWHRSDDKRFMHDHPWHFVTFVLRGSYTDVSAEGRDVLTAGSVRYRRADHAHYVEVPPTGAVTIIFTSRVVRNWGFWVKGKFVRPLRFFGKYGHPPCSEQ